MVPSVLVPSVLVPSVLVPSVLVPSILLCFAAKKWSENLAIKLIKSTFVRTVRYYHLIARIHNNMIIRYRFESKCQDSSAVMWLRSKSVPAETLYYNDL